MKPHRIFDLCLVLILTLTVSLLWAMIGRRMKATHASHTSVLTAENIVTPVATPRVKVARAKTPPNATSLVARAPLAIPEESLKVAVPRLNILIVGHRSRLADSLMLAAVDRKSRKIKLLSIPRDLAINGRKINEYLSISGIEVLKDRLQEALDIEVHKYVVFDFSTFETVIDALGGVDVHVEKNLHDARFPQGNGTYGVLSIKAGSHHMDGALALAYARSRHSTSDFDRAKRQQQIVRAVQERVVNFDFITNIDLLQAIYDALAHNIETTISFLDLVAYLRDLSDFSAESVGVISTANLLYATKNKRGQYILLPRSGDFGELQDFVRDALWPRPNK